MRELCKDVIVIPKDIRKDLTQVKQVLKKIDTKIAKVAKKAPEKKTPSLSTALLRAFPTGKNAKGSKIVIPSANKTVAKKVATKKAVVALVKAIETPKAGPAVAKKTAIVKAVVALEKALVIPKTTPPRSFKAMMAGPPPAKKGSVAEKKAIAAIVKKLVIPKTSPPRSFAEMMAGPPAKKVSAKTKAETAVAKAIITTLTSSPKPTKPIMTKQLLAALSNQPAKGLKNTKAVKLMAELTNATVADLTTPAAKKVAAKKAITKKILTDFYSTGLTGLPKSKVVKTPPLSGAGAKKILTDVYEKQLLTNFLKSVK